MTPLEKLHARTEIDPSGCHIWRGSRTAGGYGRISFNGREMYAHRLAAAEAFGMFDQRLVVLHECDNPPCVNPEHLRLGTQADNIRDMAAKGRTHNQRKTHCIHGHEFTPENTQIKGGGKYRACRTCGNADMAARRAGAAS